MVKAAREYARRAGSQNGFLLADIRGWEVEGTYDTVTCLGNALCHLGTRDLLRVLRNLEGHVTGGGHFLVEYRDVVRLLFDRKWRKRMRESRRGRTVVSVTTGCDCETGHIAKRAAEEDGSRPVEFTPAIWSPFVLEPLMESHGTPGSTVSRSRRGRAGSTSTPEPGPRGGRGSCRPA